MTDLLNRDETPVMFRRARDEPDAIRRAWAELEAAVHALVPLDLTGKSLNR